MFSILRVGKQTSSTVRRKRALMGSGQTKGIDETAAELGLSNFEAGGVVPAGEDGFVMEDDELSVQSSEASHTDSSDRISAGYHGALNLDDSLEEMSIGEDSIHTGMLKAKERDRDVGRSVDAAQHRKRAGDSSGEHSTGILRTSPVAHLEQRESSSRQENRWIDPSTPGGSGKASKNSAKGHLDSAGSNLAAYSTPGRGGDASRAAGGKPLPGSHQDKFGHSFQSSRERFNNVPPIGIPNPIGLASSYEMSPVSSVRT